MPKNITIKEAAERLLAWDNICVYSHASPDGDTLGSASALLHILENMGKKTAFRCSDECPKKFSYLFDGLKLELEDEKIEHHMTVDVADPKLLGKYNELYLENNDFFSLAVDHHGTHVPFAREEWVVGGEPSNCELMYMLFTEMNAEITPDTANCIYTGLATDTGCFKYASVKPSTHTIAAKLMELGADAAKINREIFDTRTKTYIALEQAVLSKIRYYGDGKVAVIDVTNEDREKTGATQSDTDIISSLPRMIEGVLVGITLKEKDGGVWKASVRAVLPADASEICQKFGGGGHVGAAGCAFDDTDLKSAEKSLVEAALENIG